MKKWRVVSGEWIAGMIAAVVMAWGVAGCRGVPWPWFKWSRVDPVEKKVSSENTETMQPKSEADVFYRVTICPPKGPSTRPTVQIREVRP